MCKRPFRASSEIRNRTINEVQCCMLLLLCVFVFVSPVEKKEKRTVKPRELTPFEGMEVTTD